MFGETLKRLRLSKNMTQAELGKAVGISQTAIANWEVSARQPSVDTVVLLADFFGVSVDVLLGRPSDEKKEDDSYDIRERLRRDPNMRMLFSAADKATPDHIRAAAEMLKALEPPTFPDEPPQEFPE